MKYKLQVPFMLSRQTYLYSSWDLHEAWNGWFIFIIWL